MKKSALFLIDNSKTANEFYKLTSKNQVLATDGTLMIGSVRIKANEFMVCSSSWLKNKFDDPMKELRETIQKRKKAIEAELFKTFLDILFN